MSAVSERCPGTNDDAEQAISASEASRPTDPRRTVPPEPDALSAVQEEDFDFHDTIPAPPWLDDAPESTKAPVVPS